MGWDGMGCSGGDSRGKQFLCFMYIVLGGSGYLFSDYYFLLFFLFFWV